MRKISGTIFASVSLFLLCSCTCTKPQMIAVYTAEEPDAAMKSEVWNNAPEYVLQPYTAGVWYNDIETISGMRGNVLERGTVKLLWNDKFLYAGIRMDDSDIVDEAQKDQTHIFVSADSVELFLKNDLSPCYWEIYGSANQKKTCYFFPGRGRLGLPGNNVYYHGVTAETVLDGTLNNRKDKDIGWTLLLKVPVADLTRPGVKWGENSKWKIHFVRHNYSVYLPSREVSVYPEFKSSNPHFHEGYADLILKK